VKLVKESQRPKKSRTKTFLNDVVFVSMSTVLHDLFNFFNNKKKSGKPLFFYPSTGIHCPIVHPLPLFIEHWYFNITLCMDTCITILDCVVFCCHSSVFPPPLIFFYFKFFFVVSTADCLPVPLTLFPFRRPRILRWSRVR